MANHEISLLEKKHKKKQFDCQVASLNDYLHKRASQDVKRKLASCFVLSNSNADVLGYYTLTNHSILKEDIPEKLRKKIPYRDYPVTLLGRLAVDVNHRGQQYGAILLIDALYQSYLVSLKVASAAVVVDPIDEAAKQFYTKYGFIPLENKSRLFLPMTTIKTLLEQQKIL